MHARGLLGRTRRAGSHRRRFYVGDPPSGRSTQNLRLIRRAGVARARPRRRVPFFRSFSGSAAAIVAAHPASQAGDGSAGEEGKQRKECRPALAAENRERKSPAMQAGRVFGCRRHLGRAEAAVRPENPSRFRRSRERTSPAERGSAMQTLPGRKNSRRESAISRPGRGRGRLGCRAAPDGGRFCR